ncbi:MAG: T9SS type A sorting domain-containing protein [Bacteroidales bacterium]|nr:T9SS type A sorting domain-containing protein [Bacteroidales bacterium]MCF8458370.1 T9SS type A sorting domain-containing protein [Bacteroidales bacterium]
MKTMTLFAFTVILSFMLSNLNAQQTGNFATSITFMGASRTLACHVPTSYDSTYNYQLMVCLHGMGDNAINFRNALINSLGWPTVFPNTIFVCPDGGSDQNKDFYTPAGDEYIIDECISFAKQNYSIDTTRIILEGFSLGGRSAFKFGLDYYEKFLGLLLNTPAIQGLADAINDPILGMIYNYGNASKIPIYTTIGSEDVLYVYSFKKVNELLMKNDGIIKYVPVPGLGHSIPNSNYTSPSMAFFDDPTTGQHDLHIFEIDMDDRSCEVDINPGCFIRNIGSDTITSAEIEYDIDGISGTYNWSGNIGPYQHALVSLPQISVSAGIKTLELNVGLLNSNMTDSFANNNSISKEIEIATEGNEYPLFEGWEGNADSWIFPETGSVFAWYTDDEVMKDGLYSIATFNTIFLFYTDGYSESFLSPVMDLTSVPAPKLSFDLAFNYHKYTPPYFTMTVFFADTLEVSVSTDCGQTFETVYYKGGADLATAAEPILNPLSIAACFFTPDSTEWRKEVIDLSAFSTNAEAIVKFTYISNMGGSIYIDNINFTANPISIVENDPQGFEMYPNPAQNILNIEIDKPGKTQIKLYDVSGREVLSTESYGQSSQINISGLGNGFYNVEIISGNEKEVRKLLIRK